MRNPQATTPSTTTTTGDEATTGRSERGADSVSGTGTGTDTMGATPETQEEQPKPGDETR